MANAGRSADTAILAKTVGCLSASAVGDALGGTTEGWSTAQIRERWGGWVTGIVEPYHRDAWQSATPMSPFHKGDGHVTDDTLMTHLMASLYVELGRHLDPWDLRDHLVPRLRSQVVWIPELERMDVPARRLSPAENYLVLRLLMANADPREAGVGNVVNCGAAMYMAPVGVVNAGDPEGAYDEAIGLAGAHQSSYGREAAGVLAAAVSQAVQPGATLPDVLAVAQRLARDGTAAAIGAVLAAAADYSSWEDAVTDGGLREAIRPFDTVGDDYSHPSLAARRPSRVHAIEELPIALGMLSVGAGDPWPAILGSVNYGRDADSIAAMAGAIGGALMGIGSIPTQVLDGVLTASRLDVTSTAAGLADAAVAIREADLERMRDIERRTLACLGAADAAST